LNEGYDTSLHSEDGSNMVLRNVGVQLLHYMTTQPEEFEMNMLWMWKID